MKLAIYLKYKMAENNLKSCPFCLGKEWVCRPVLTNAGRRLAKTTVWETIPGEVDAALWTSEKYFPCPGKCDNYSHNLRAWNTRAEAEKEPSE